MVKVANIVFNPFINDSRVWKESITLGKNGYSLEVIAHGNIGLKSYEEKDIFAIRRFEYLDRKKTKSKIAKLKIYLVWMIKVIQHCKEFDILHCNDLNSLPIGIIIKKFFNKNVIIVYDAHEYETETHGLSGIQQSLARFLEKFFIKYADKIITVSSGIADEYARLYDVQKPALVLNTPHYKKIEKKDLFRKTFGISKEQTIFLYQGNLGKGRGIEILLDTFKALDSSRVIVFMGYGQLEGWIKEKAKKHENIYFHEAMNPAILLDYTSSADFGIATIEDSCLSYHYCLPNKMFEYIMAEVPVIVSSLPEMKKVVEDNYVGIVAKDNTIDGLKNAILDAIKLDKVKMSSSLKMLKKVYSWEEQEKVLLEVYEGLLA